MNALPSDDQQVPQPAASTVGIAKEVEPAASGSEVSPLKEVGQDVELPKEVSAAGVRTTPTSVKIPQPVAQMGVTAVQSTPPPTAPSSPLPLSDDQIAKGLTQSLANSWRWLAEWCKKRLKQLRLTT